MIPVMCRVPHRPDEGKYGDCVAACVASIMELDADDVPHFFHDNGSDEITHQRMCEFLSAHKLQPFIIALPGTLSLAEILAHGGAQNANTYYTLTGAVEGGTHMVVCKGGAIVHNPSWIKTPLIGPVVEHGNWVVMVLARS